MPFTNENKKFKTDITKGYPHATGQPRGSVTQLPIWDDGEALYLEHVINKQNGTSCYWFMWYDENGIPKTKISAVFGEEDILNVIRNISQIQLQLSI